MVSTASLCQQQRAGVDYTSQSIVLTRLLLTKLLDVVGLATGVLLKLFLQYGSIRLEEILYSNRGIVVLFGRLQWLQGSEIFPT